MSSIDVEVADTASSILAILLIDCVRLMVWTAAVAHIAMPMRSHPRGWVYLILDERAGASDLSNVEALATLSVT
ncbi:MAG: hypothetical protein HMLIMOIP_001308 [Candidatus Nitrosomirales archaeon]|jgi:hypothetical protein